MNKLYVGNLSPSVTVEDLEQLFAERELPAPEQVLVKSGYAFVDFPDQNAAIKAIEDLSGKCVDFDILRWVMLLAADRGNQSPVAQSSVLFIIVALKQQQQKSVFHTGLWL